MNKNLNKIIKHLFWGLLIIIGGLYLYVMVYLGVTFMKGTGEEYFFLNLGIAVLLELALIYGLFSLFKLIGFNRIIYSILGGIIIGGFTAIITEMALWFVPIGDSVSIIAGVLGFIYGVTLFPIYLKSDKIVDSKND